MIDDARTIGIAQRRKEAKNAKSRQVSQNHECSRSSRGVGLVVCGWVDDAALFVARCAWSVWQRGSAVWCCGGRSAQVRYGVALAWLVVLALLPAGVAVWVSAEAASGEDDGAKCCAGGGD